MGLLGKHRSSLQHLLLAKIIWQSIAYDTCLGSGLDDKPVFKFRSAFGLAGEFNIKIEKLENKWM
jgi:hypothetical protein